MNSMSSSAAASFLLVSISKSQKKTNCYQNKLRNQLQLEKTNTLAAAASNTRAPIMKEHSINCYDKNSKCGSNNNLSISVQMQ